ncbi:MAG: M23 family metallopeptidase [Myxococcota bacterium]
MRRGLLDFGLTCLTCVAVYVQTPVGALVDRALEATLGVERRSRNLTDFFAFDANSGPSDNELDRIASLRRSVSGQTTRRAREAGVPVELYRALELAFDSTTDSVKTVARSISQREKKFGHLDAAIEAHVLGDAPVERAIAAATRRGIEAPWRLKHHSQFLTRLQRERSEPVVNQVMAIHTALSFQWPVRRKHRITSPFGYRGDPFLGTRRFHNGVDLGIPVGTEILAAQTGRVERAAYDSINGYYVQLSHGYGLSTAYCHNSTLLVRAGDSTGAGDPIALSGSSGRSTGPHLHYIVRIGGKAIDPERFKER